MFTGVSGHLEQEEAGVALRQEVVRGVILVQNLETGSLVRGVILVQNLGTGSLAGNMYNYTENIQIYRKYTNIQKIYKYTEKIQIYRKYTNIQKI